MCPDCCLRFVPAVLTQSWLRSAWHYANAMPGFFSGINMRTHMDQMGNCSVVWSWCWRTHVLSWYLKGLCGNRIGRIRSSPPHRPRPCSVWKTSVGWRKACTLADQIWGTNIGGLGWWENKKENTQVLERCLERRRALVIKSKTSKAADCKLRCGCGTWKCWTCQTIFCCSQCGDTKSIAWRMDYVCKFISCKIHMTGPVRQQCVSAVGQWITHKWKKIEKCLMHSSSNHCLSRY